MDNMFTKGPAPPWTAEQVEKLNAYQSVGWVHPFTCPNRGDGQHPGGHGELVATEAGWTCPSCDYTQDWAHAFMFDGPEGLRPPFMGTGTRRT